MNNNKLNVTYNLLSNNDMLSDEIENIIPVKGKNIQLHDLTGANVFPKTTTSMVINNDGISIGNIESNAQENRIESLSINNIPLPIDNNKNININTNDLLTEGFGITIKCYDYINEISVDKNIIPTKDEIDKEFKVLTNNLDNVNQELVSLDNKINTLETDLNKKINQKVNLTELEYYTPTTELKRLYATKEDLNDISKIKYKIVDKLPTKNISESIIYLLKDSESKDNNYIEYIWVNQQWERFGNNIDLSDYAKKQDIPVNLSQLNNDTGFIDNEVNDLINYPTNNKFNNVIGDINSILDNINGNNI